MLFAEKQSYYVFMSEKNKSQAIQRLDHGFYPRRRNKVTRQKKTMT